MGVVGARTPPKKNPIPTILVYLVTTNSLLSYTTGVFIIQIMLLLLEICDINTNLRMHWNCMAPGLCAPPGPLAGFKGGPRGNTNKVRERKEGRQRGTMDTAIFEAWLAFVSMLLHHSFITRTWLCYVWVFAIANPFVCLSSVCLPVRFVYPTYGVELFGNTSSPLCTLAIL